MAAGFALRPRPSGTTAAGLARLRPGTKVMLEGPYGSFTRHRRRRRKVLLIGAGVGITPLRALFESFTVPGSRVSSCTGPATPTSWRLRREIDEIAARRKAKVFYLVGSRDEHPEYLTPAHLQLLVRDVRQRDVYVCGPPGSPKWSSASLRDLGVPGRQVHTESFEL